MFAKFTTFVLASSALLATGVLANNGGGSPPPPPPPSVNVNQCNVENQMCCNQTQNYTESTKSLLGALGFNTQGLNGQIGLSCSSLDGTESPTCQANPVCCTGENTNGFFALDCSPLNGF